MQIINVEDKMERKKEEKNKRKFNEKGITLIALVVTIVVLLILAGISINLVLGENGIIKKAKEAKTAHEQGWNNDIDAMDNYEKYIDESVNGNSEDEDTGDKVYAKLYDDGTLIFSSTDYTASDKNLAEDYGDISKNKFWINEEKGIIEGNLWGWIDTKTFENKATSVIIYDKIRPINTNYWFEGYTGDSLELGNLDTSNVEDMSCMFGGCSNLTELDVRNFNTGKVTNMTGMFSSCNALTKLDVSDFDTSNVTNTVYMFIRCSNLTELDISSFDTSNATDMYGMFDNCAKLANIYVGENWNVSQADTSAMFYGCGTSTVTKK